MSANALETITAVEAQLWQAADQLRANSKLTSSEYCMPVLGVIFLRHAANRYATALRRIEAANWSLTPGRYVGVAPLDVRRDHLMTFKCALRINHFVVTFPYEHPL